MADESTEHLDTSGFQANFQQPCLNFRATLFLYYKYSLPFPLSNFFLIYFIDFSFSLCFSSHESSLLLVNHRKTE